MPKGPCKTIPIDKEKFMNELHNHDLSIRKISKLLPISDKTIRRALTNGQIREKHIVLIAKYLDVTTDKLGVSKYSFRSSQDLIKDAEEILQKINTSRQRIFWYTSNIYDALNRINEENRTIKSNINYLESLINKIESV